MLPAASYLALSRPLSDRVSSTAAPAPAAPELRMVRQNGPEQHPPHPDLDAITGASVRTSSDTILFYFGPTLDDYFHRSDFYFHRSDHFHRTPLAWLVDMATQ